MLTSGLGVMYWILAARVYSPAEVGMNAAIISSLTFLAGIAQLNLRPVLSRFLPVSGRSSGRFLQVAYAAAVGAAILFSTAYLGGSTIWADQGVIPMIRENLLLALGFIATTALWTVFSLQDGALIGLRTPVVMVLENVGFGVAKIAVVLVLASVSAARALAITISWIGPMIVAVIGVSFAIRRFLLPAHVRAHPELAGIKIGQGLRFVAGDYVGSLFALSYVALLPAIVVNQVGAAEAAQFYVAWVIISALQIIPPQMVVSLVVDTARDPSTFRHQGRRMLIGMLRVIGPLAIGLVLSANILLGVFGSAYEPAAPVLRLLALSTIPYSVNILYLGAARVFVAPARIIVVQAATAAVILGLSWALVPRLGIAGVGWAFLAGHASISVVLLSTALRFMLRRGPETDPS
ncbi:MAG: hypothetical protein H0V73_11075 [Chloroflexi bacterium]|nr:hypothetical protein [Chloroflexota bacterium]